MTLPVRRISKLGAIPLTTVPNAKTLIAEINNCLVVNFSNKKALIGIMIPFTNIKTVVSHCALFAVTLISTIIGGIAVIIRV
jgi:hypothetical protein